MTRTSSPQPSFRNALPAFEIEEDELIVDNFAGGGGASEAIEQALGRHIDIAINHDREAVAMHAINHPHTKHLCESVWKVNIKTEVAGRRVGLAWFSPDCKHFSKAKGGKPVEKKIRGLAWVALKWAGLVKPRVIMLENVSEFATWSRLKNGLVGEICGCGGASPGRLGEESVKLPASRIERSLFILAAVI